jgi:hypothetical protein
MKERYFIVFFEWDTLAKRGKGRRSFKASEYPNQIKMMQYLAKHFKCKENAVLITNIIELSEEDFVAWSS